MKSKLSNNKVIRKISTNSLRKKQQMIYETNPNYLFYYFLIKDLEIDLFENSKKEKLTNVMQRSFDSYNFYLLFIKMNKEYIWNNFKFPFIYFKILYYKAKKLRKKIIKYAHNKKIEINDIFESYNPDKNKIKLNEYNWNIPIEISYQKLQKKKIREARIRVDSDSNFIDYFKTNLLILTRDKVKSKKLIFSGNLCNIYLEDINMRNKNKNLNHSNLCNNEKIININGISIFRKKSNNKNSNSSFKSSFKDKNIKNRNNNIGTSGSLKNTFMNSTISNKNNDNNTHSSLKNIFMNKTISNKNQGTNGYNSLKKLLLNKAKTNRNKNQINYTSLKKKMLNLGSTNFTDEINIKNIKDTYKKSNLFPYNSFNKSIKMKNRINLKHNNTNISSEKKLVNFHLNKSDFFYN